MPMDLRDDRWTRLLGGYRVPYDPRKALLALERGESVDSAWNELWNELHHQGDVGEASFAAVPHLVRIHELRGIPDWNTYLIASIIELARDNPRNPKLPADFEKPYETAWTQLVEIGLRELKLAEGYRSSLTSSACWESQRGSERSDDLRSNSRKTNAPSCSQKQAGPSGQSPLDPHLRDARSISAAAA